MTNPYEILGVLPGASEEEIKKAYKRLALEWHPDRHGGDKNAEEKFKEINNAYQIITGKTKAPQQSGFPFGNEDDIFEFFRNASSPFGPFTEFRTKSIPTLSLHLSLEEAYNGGRKTVHFTKKEKCSSCNGIGRDVGEGVCKSCGGAGRSATSTSPMFQIFLTCQACGGLGKPLGGQCKTCLGSGFTSEQQEITVDIPPGISHGETIPFSGNFRVVATHIKHPSFEYMPCSLDIGSEIEISLFDMMIGGETVVKTLAGDMRVKIESGLRPGSQLRIRNAGMKNRQGNKGDHVVRIWAKMPKLTENHQQALKKMREEIEGEKND